ncbi:MAG: response regulator [Pseudomonadota bacterium]
MPQTLEDLVMMQPPTAERPLLGTIVLVVEDSRHACEVLRLICQRSGARIRRADSLAAAKRHLSTYRPRLAVIDLGLPDGSGLELIAQLANADPRIEGIIATSGDDSLRAAALQAGADTFLPKPLASVIQFQQSALALLCSEITPRPVGLTEADRVTPDPIALRDDLALAADLLRNRTDQTAFDYVATFLAGLAKCTGDVRIASLGDMVSALARGDDGPAPADIAVALEDQMAALELV